MTSAKSTPTSSRSAKAKLSARGRLAQRRGEETRARILESARRHFGHLGYEAASVDEICVDARVSKGAFYHHFSSKHALFLALLQEWLQALDAALAASRQETVPATILNMVDAFQDIMVTAGDRFPMFLEFWVQASRDKQVWKATIAPYRRYQEYFASLIREGIEEGSLANVDPQMAGRMIVSMAMGLLLQSLLDPAGAPWDKVARESMHALIHALGPAVDPTR